MRRRFTTVVVCLLYLSVALAIGVVHHHEHEHDQCPAGEHDDCSACQWQLSAVTDVPNVLPLIFGSVLEPPLQAFDFISYSALSFSFSPSRAPPAVSA